MSLCQFSIAPVCSACLCICMSAPVNKECIRPPMQGTHKKSKAKKKGGGGPVYCDLWNQDNDCAVLSISEGHHMAAVTVTLSSTHQIGTTLESLSARGGIASPRYPPAIHISPGSSQHAEIKSGHQSYLLLSSFLGEIRMAELPLFGRCL